MAKQTRENRRQSGANRGARPERQTRASARATTPARQDGAPDHTNRNGIIFLVASVYLIATLLNRVFVPAHESPLRTEQLMTIGLDVLCLVGLVAIKKHVPGWWVLFLGRVRCRSGPTRHPLRRGREQLVDRASLLHA